MLRRTLAFSLAMLCTGCSAILFHPDRIVRTTPDRLGIPYEDLWLDAGDGVKLHGWFFPASSPPARASVLHLHGNAQNISTHFYNVAWLPAHGFQVITLDYRGFGRSGGKASLPEVFRDIDAVLRWMAQDRRTRDCPWVLLGQSIGANLGSHFLATHAEYRRRFAAIVLDAPFASYRELAREKLAGFWLTWPLQYPLSWLMPERYSPIHGVGRLSGVPLLILCSSDDVIVPSSHCRHLFEAAAEPKTLRMTPGPHIAGFAFPAVRQQVLAFLEAALRQRPCAEAGVPLLPADVPVNGRRLANPLPKA